MKRLTEVIDSPWFSLLAYPAWWTLIAVAAAMMPVLAPLLLFVACGLLILKLLALSGGSLWIFTKGPTIDRYIRAREAQLGPDPEPDARRQVFFRAFRKYDVTIAPFGVMDWKWRAQIAEDFQSAELSRNIRGLILKALRAGLFRYEAQAIAFAVLLVFIPYDWSGEVSNLNEVLALLVAALLIVNTFLMGLEIFLGNALLLDGYDRYFHFSVNQRRRRWRNYSLIAEVGHFARLILYSIAAVSASCMCYYACRFSFSGILTKPSTSGEDFVNRIRMFCEFFSFTLGTFATAGFGDVHPTGIVARLVMTTIHLMSMSFILVLLQLLLSMRQNEIHTD